MSNLTVHTFKWTGMPGAPGYSNFYTLDQVGLVPEAVRMVFWNFFNNIKGFLPASVSISPNSTYRTIDETTGSFLNEQSYADSPSDIPGAGTVNYAGPVGGVVTWHTSTPGATRLMKGRTFLVPLSTNVMQSDGTFIDSALASLRGFAQTVATQPNPVFCVYRRPKGEVPGKAGLVTGSSVPDLMAVLRSRRD